MGQTDKSDLDISAMKQKEAAVVRALNLTSGDPEFKLL